MRYPPSEKLEIIRLVELSHLPARRTLAQLGIPRTSFYRWYDRYLTGGPEALEDRRSRPGRVWNRIPDEVRGQIVQLALKETDLSPRELAVRFTDTEGYDHAFFEQTVVQPQISNGLLERKRLTAKIPNLIGRRFAGRISRQALLARLQEVLRPAVIEVLVDPLTAAQLGDAVLTAQALQNDPDLLFGTKMPARCTPDVLHDLLSRGFLAMCIPSHLQSLPGYDEPETLSYSITQSVPGALTPDNLRYLIDKVASNGDHFK